VLLFSGRKHSEESKKRIANARLGSKHSDETRNKISNTVKKSENSGRFKIGQKKIEGSGKPDQQIEVSDIKTNNKNYYNSISETAKALNINQSVISNFF
jgi:DNA invertase Pin-like site-specific DNA recombinase